MARVLVVDDEAGIREFLAEALGDDDHEVTAASSGEAAWERLERESFEVVITDLKMPGISGLELLKRVRERQPEVEVVVLTAHGNVDSAVEAMRAGAFDVPSDFAAAAGRPARTVRAMLEGLRAAEEAGKS